MIALVPPEEWEKLGLEAILRAEFNCGLPNPERSRIIGYYDNGLEAFIMAENLLYVGMPFTYPNVRHNGQVMKLIEYTQERCKEEKACVISIASHPKYEKILESRGMWKVNGNLYRVNYDED